MRAKMKVTSIEQLEHGEILKMSAVCRSSYDSDGSDENNTFAKFTPSATMEMHVNNPDLAGTFKPGQAFYVDFTEVAA